MVKITDLKCCSDCGTVYYGMRSNGVCPNCKTNLSEAVTDNNTERSLDR